MKHTSLFKNVELIVNTVSDMVNRVQENVNIVTPSPVIKKRKDNVVLIAGKNILLD